MLTGWTSTRRLTTPAPQQRTPWGEPSDGIFGIHEVAPSEMQAALDKSLMSWVADQGIAAGRPAAGVGRDVRRVGIASGRRPLNSGSCRGGTRRPFRGGWGTIRVLFEPWSPRWPDRAG